MNKKTAIILDDHKLFGESYAMVLEKYALFDSVHTFHDEDAFIQFILKYNLQKFYIFLDYYLKERNGLSVIADIHRINKHCKVIFITSATSWGVIGNLESHQPHAILSKSDGLDIVVTCIQQIEKGCYYLCPTFAALKEGIPSNGPVFTPREIEILHLFMEGMSTTEIAEKTFLSKHTIVAHKRNMMAKANCSRVGKLVAYARRIGVV